MPIVPRMELNQGRVNANGLEFAYLEAGSGPLALCLHGFPDSAWSWRHLLSELAAAGFHAVAPFMRGYAPTQVPDDAHYYPAALGADACALHAARGSPPTSPPPSATTGTPSAAPRLPPSTGDTQPPWVNPRRSRRSICTAAPTTPWASSWSTTSSSSWRRGPRWSCSTASTTSSS